MSNSGTGMSNSKQEELYHVVTITAQQQAAVKYCLYNWMQHRVLAFMSALQRTDEVTNPDSLQKASDHVLKTINKYDTLTMHFPHFADYIRGGIKLFYFSEENFALIQKSLEMYSSETANQVIGGDKARIIDVQMIMLQDLFKESRQYKFTLNEIAKFKGMI